MADAAEIITPSKIAKSDFSSIRIPGDTSLKDFQVELKNIAGKQKNILIAVKNAVEDFFKNEMFKDTSDGQQTELANRLCNQIFSNLKDLKDQTSSIDLGKVSAIVISDNPKATLDKYVKEEFDKIKDSAEFKEALGDSTFTESELESFEKKVLEAIAKTVVEQARSYKEDFKKDLPKSSKSELHSMAEFSIRHKKEIEDGIVLPVLDFKAIESKVLTSVKERINQISSNLKNLIQTANVRRQPSSIIFHGTSLNNIFGQNSKNKKWYEKSVKERFLKADSILKKVSKFMEHPIRNVKRVIVNWGKTFAAKVGAMLNYFFPITEVMFLIGVASKIVQFSFWVLGGIQKIVSWSWNAVKFITRNTFGVLYKVLKKVTSYKLTRDIFKAFFRSYIGAYVLGMAIGFFYYHIRKIMPKLKEWYALIREKLDPFIVFFQETTDKILNVLGRTIATAADIVIAFQDYFEHSEDKSLVGAFEFVTGNLRNSDGNLVFEDGSNVFDTIEKARLWISRTFTLQNMASIKKAAITSVTGGISSLAGAWAGAKLGAMLGTALLGPFGTIAGGIIGAFVGASVGQFLNDLISDTFNDAKKVNMTETAYQKYLRTELGEITRYSNIGDRFKDKSGNYDVNTDFGYVLDALDRQSSGGEFTAEDVKRFNKIGLKIKEGKAPSYELQRLRYINNINESSIVGEIQSVVDLFNLLKDSDYSFDEDNFKDERFSKAAHTTNLALTSSGEQYLGNELKNDRQYLIFRLSRAYQIYDLFKNKNYIEEYEGRYGVVKPKDFLDLYDEVSFIPNSEEQIISKRLHSEVQRRLKNLGKFKGFWESWSKNEVCESQAKSIDWLNDVFIRQDQKKATIYFGFGKFEDAIQEGSWDSLFGKVKGEFKTQQEFREDFERSIQKLETETDAAIQKNDKESIQKISEYRQRLFNIIDSLADIDPDERIILIKRIEELEKKTNQASALLDSGREPSEF